MSFDTKPVLALALGAFLASTSIAIAQDKMADANLDTGFYVGLVQVERSVETIFGDIDGDGDGFLVGYRMSPDLRFELERQDIDYSDLTVGETLVHDSQGEFTYFSIVVSGHYGNWEPYAKLIFGDSEVTVKETTDGTTSPSLVSDSGEAFGFGFDYHLTDNISIRGDYTIQSEHQDVLSFAPIWRF